MSIIDNHQEEFNKAVGHFQSEIAVIKTGRANPSMLDNIKVEAYGVMSPLNQVASIGVADARSLTIQPWDKSVLKDIEKAILESGLNINPVNDGDRIRLNLPMMTEETRKETVKLLNQKAEEAKKKLETAGAKVEMK